jgi:tRNA(Ile2) C34 agmatinyltransferase TiaS
MRTFAIGLMVFVATAVPMAHHGLAAFDRTTKITLEGTVTDFHFVTPHVVIEFEVKDETGRVQTWQAELTTPKNLKGWTATSLEPGDVVTVTGYRAKSGALFLWVTELSASNGLKLRGA